MPRGRLKEKDMKKSLVSLLALATAVAIVPAALAGAQTLCPNTAQQGGAPFTQTFTPVSGPDGSCGTDAAWNMSIPNADQYAKLTWSSSSSGYPTDLTLGDLGGITASVLPSESGQPYYELEFHATNLLLRQQNPSDELLLIEFQQTTLTGDSLVLDPNSTVFDLYDNDASCYLFSTPNCANGQGTAQSLNAWLAEVPGLSSEPIGQIRIAMGLANGSGPGEGLTVYSADVTKTATSVPEPASPLFLGICLLVLAIGFVVKVKMSGLVSHS
jgi:hypothetical protein